MMDFFRCYSTHTLNTARCYSVVALCASHWMSTEMRERGEERASLPLHSPFLFQHGCPPPVYRVTLQQNPPPSTPTASKWERRLVGHPVGCVRRIPGPPPFDADFSTLIGRRSLLPSNTALFVTCNRLLAQRPPVLKGDLQKGSKITGYRVGSCVKLPSFLQVWTNSTVYILM